MRPEYYGKKMNRVMVERWLDSQLDAMFQFSQCFKDGGYELKNISADPTKLHVSEETVACIAQTLELNIDVLPRKNDADYPSEISVTYKGIRVFALSEVSYASEEKGE